MTFICYGANTTQIIKCGSPLEFLNIIEWWANLLSPIFSHIIIVLAIVIIIIIMIEKEMSDIKWFIFHCLILNLSVELFSDLYLIFPVLEKIYAIRLVKAYLQSLSCVSIFPLACSRLVFLYFPNFYEKFVTRKTLIFWILSYNLVVIGLILLSNVIHPLYHYSIVLIMLTFIFSFFIFFKIYQMMKMLGPNSRVNTLEDLHRAAIICLVQAGTFSIYLIVNLYIHYYQSVGGAEKYGLFWTLYLTFYKINDVFYKFFVVIDICMTLFILKTYRNALIRGYKKVVGNVKFILTLQKRTSASTPMNNNLIMPTTT